jgi:hypothetical protein
MGTIVSFRIGQNDVESLGKYFQPTFDSDDLLRVPNYNTIVRTLIGGVPTQPFSMATLPPLGTPNPRLFDALKQLSAAKYGRPKAAVEKEVFERITVKEAPKPVAPAPTAVSPFAAPGTPAAWSPPGAAPAPSAPASSGSFLDEWLNKRRTGTPSPTVGPTLAPPPAIAPPPAAVPTPVSLTAPAPIIPADSGELTIDRSISTHGAAPSNDHNAVAASSDLDHFQQVAQTNHDRPQQKDAESHGEAAGGTNNISSDALAQNEVDMIAEQLRQRLDDTKADTASDAAAVPVVQAKLDAPDTSNDTIVIDPDGVFRNTAS